MAAHPLFHRYATRLSVGGLILGRSGPLRTTHPPRAPFSKSSTCSAPNRWSPPPEPEKPPVPYTRGFRFTARRVKPPRPFQGRYWDVPAGPLRDFLEQFRSADDDFLKSTTLVDYCLLAAAYPLPCEESGETASFKVLRELTVGDGSDRGRGSQVVTCKRRGQREPLVAKIYDLLYYPFANEDFWDMPNDVVADVENDFAVESAAYALLDERLGGILIPKFYGSWLLDLPLKEANRPVGFILMEHLKGVPLSTLDPKLYSQEARLRILALSIEAQLEMRFAGVIHEDVAPRNVICSGKDFMAGDFRIKIIDFGLVNILPLAGIDAPCKSEPLPESPVEWFWNCPVSKCRTGCRKGREDRNGTSG